MDVAPRRRTLRAGKFQLPGDEVEPLRSACLGDPAPASAVQGSLPDGWLEANRHYLQEQRQLGERSMRALMERLGVSSIQSAGEALDLIELALHVFSPAEGYRGATGRKGANKLWIVNPYCPIFSALEEHNWRGVTACPSWYIRRGWLDALGVDATDFVVTEKKWGHRTCTAVINIESPAAVGA